MGIGQWAQHTVDDIIIVNAQKWFSNYGKEFNRDETDVDEKDDCKKNHHRIFINNADANALFPNFSIFFSYSPTQTQPLAISL